MTTVSINQPAYLPWLGYFERINNADLHVVLDHVQFEKNSFTNRNRIRTSSGEQWLTIPVRTKGKFGVTINELELDSRVPWNQKHWRTIQMAYAKAPCFTRNIAPLAPLFERSYETFMDVFNAFDPILRSALHIDTPQVCSSTLDVKSTKSQLVLDICVQLGATRYLSGALGRDYLDMQSFQKAGILVEFQDFKHPVYKQLQGDFVPNLACIDYLACTDEVSWS